jgi:hypothetical protein
VSEVPAGDSDSCDNSRNKQQSLDEETMALSMTTETISIMERWGQAAKDRRKKEVKDDIESGKWDQIRCWLMSLIRS